MALLLFYNIYIRAYKKDIFIKMYTHALQNSYKIKRSN